MTPDGAPGTAGPAPRLCCEPLRTDAVDDETSRTVALRFKALGDPVRVRLLSLVATGPDGEACVCDLQAHVNLTQPTVSHHLKVLWEAGLLAREKRGTWVYYRLDPETIEALRTVLA